MPAKKSTDIKKDDSDKKNDSLKKENKKLKEEIKEKEEKLLRSYADFQNYQKRMEKELTVREEETKKKYLYELLDLNELLKKHMRITTQKTGLN